MLLQLNRCAQVADARDNMSTLTNANSALTVEKRRLEGDVRGMQAELDNLMNAVKNGEEKAKKAIVDAGTHRKSHFG